MRDLRIVFMGTPEFAVAAMGCFLINGLNIVGVVTAPDKPAGRGRKISRSPVKIFAEKYKLPLFQPSNLKNQEFLDHLRSLNADVFVVVAFRMLPEAVWTMPPMGTINLHASLLPDYRGAAPINHAIINGETVTGVTTFFINDKIDTGNIILREEVQIFPFDNAADLHERLMKQGARLLVRTLAHLGDGKIKPVPQSELSSPAILKTAPKIFPADCIINWNNDLFTNYNLIRGLSPNPSARSYFKKGDEILLFKIFESHPEADGRNLKPGSIITDGKSFLKIACRDGAINIASLQIEGKNRMNVQDFLRGFKITDYIIPA